MIERIKAEFADLQAAIAELLSWARYDDAQPETKELASIMEALAARDWKALGEKPAGFAFKGIDGKPWWFQWTTNAFMDREHEIFTTQAITDLVERHDKEIAEGKRQSRGEFWFWHIPGTHFADVQWEAPVGRFLAQAGPFIETEAR